MRFEVVHSNVIENGWFIKDNVGNLTFPTSTNLNDLFCYCRILNKLHEENKVLKIEIVNLKDSMFSEKDFSDYLQACHEGLNRKY